MAWYWWVLLWLLLVGAATVLVVLSGFRLWRKLRSLQREVSAAAERVGEAREAAARDAARNPAAVQVVAAFASPATIRAERARDERHGRRRATGTGDRPRRAPSRRGHRVR